MKNLVGRSPTRRGGGILCGVFCLRDRRAGTKGIRKPTQSLRNSVRGGELPVGPPVLGCRHQYTVTRLGLRAAITWLELRQLFGLPQLSG